ncbi:heme-dependent oxidative N-demethylase family protein [Aspergillus udagawae]|uniref:HRQ family protein n=1 Tax=Aspergillus udagawae TaxID=91492 RepID=A0A8E0QUH1_9EURO|nr:uncharacterized protein Aud_005991 [Aspergillus udagawae]GIC89569.1 hypothetical protein Aud_005991 [Aspergillus udagawae]
MQIFGMLGDWWLSGLALAALVGLYFTFDRSQRREVWPRISLQSRKTSAAGTPPRSVSPDKKPGIGSVSQVNYANVLPPQRRQALAALRESPAESKEIDEAEVRRFILPMTMDYRNCQEERYTPTGFSVEEIKRLGDFPDYAALSGVPLPHPYDEFVIDKALPRPYRPFRWTYHQTMSLTKMETDWWIELEGTYKARIAQRKELYAKHGSSLLGYLPGSELACKELMEMVLQFLCARYPQYFSLEGKRIFKNKILDTEQDIRAKHPLEVLLDNVPEDFAIMLRDAETGFYFLRAAVVCSALGWNVGLKLGLQLHQIHEPIPDYKEKMQFSMDRFFSKMPTDKPIQRGSWGLEVGQPLYMPPGDPHEKLRFSQDPSLQLADCNLRVDWQTLRRLPLSAAVVFNFKALFTPVSEFRDEPCVPALVAKVLKEGKDNLMKYKNTWHVEHIVLPKLEEWAKEQEGQGLVDKNWQVATLDESPWFRNWEDKWHRQQGF